MPCSQSSSAARLHCRSRNIDQYRCKHHTPTRRRGDTLTRISPSIKALDENIVAPTGFAIHADGNLPSLDECEVGAGELASLVGIGDFKFSKARQRFVQSLDAEVGRNLDRHAPGQYPSAEPVDDSDKETAIHWIVVASARHADMVDEQLDHIGADAQAVILEPIARNTAPAIALAAFAAEASSPLLVMPSGHVIADVAAFYDAMQAALPLVAEGWLVTFGIAPTRPRLATAGSRSARRSEETMLATGDHAWNGGIFLFRANTYLDALSTHPPSRQRVCDLAEKRSNRDTDRARCDQAERYRLPDRGYRTWQHRSAVDDGYASGCVGDPDGQR
jgi:hypothetical protein